MSHLEITLKRMRMRLEEEVLRLDDDPRHAAVEIVTGNLELAGLLLQAEGVARRQRNARLLIDQSLPGPRPRLAPVR